MAVLSPFTGKLSDRMEPRLLSSVGMAVITAGLLVLSTLGFDTPILLMIGGLALVGLGFAVFSSPNMNAIMSSIERKEHGVGAGMLATMRLLGQTFSMGTALIVFTLLMGQVQIEPMHYPMFLSASQITYWVFAGMCVVGVVASVARGRIHK